MDLNKWAEEADNACPKCNAQVTVTDVEGEPPVQRVTGVCPVGHLVERQRGLETPWELQAPA